MSFVRRLLAGIRPAFQAIHRASGRAARALLGEVDWHAPPWARWTAARIHSGTRAAIARARQQPRQTATIAAASVLLLGGSYAGWRWYENRPRPIETAFTVTAPQLTCYECEPPGKPNPLLVTFSGSAPTGSDDPDGAFSFCSASPTTTNLSYADPREDRVVFYGTLTSDVQELVYRIKATDIGTYTIPPAYGEAMYDRSLLARSIAGKIEVVKP